MGERLTNSDILTLLKENQLSAKEGAQLILRIQNGEKVMRSEICSDAKTNKNLIMYTNHRVEIGLKEQEKRSVEKENLLIIQIGARDSQQLSQLVNGCKEYCNVITVEQGDGKKEKGTSFEINYQKEDQIRLIYDELEAMSSIPDEVVFWMVGENQMTKDGLEQMITGMYCPIVQFVKLLFERKWNKRLTLYFAYQKQSNVQPEFAAWNGFGRTVMLENTKINCVTVGYEHINQLINEIQYKTQNENDVLYQGSKRLVNAMDKKADVPTKTQIRDGGVYVITGGNGGVARKFARVFASRYHAQLVLTGRSKENDEIKQFLKELSQDGAEAIYVSANCSTKEGAAAILEATISKFGKVHGIIHSAGVMGDAYLYNKDVTGCNRVFEPKIFGCIQMDEAFKNQNLDFFITFSSTAGVFGNAGQADYSYANNFMDHWVQLRDAKVKEGVRYGKFTSINWPLWKDAGMNVDAATLKNMVTRSGIEPIDIEDAMTVLENSLTICENQLIAITGDVARIQKEVQLKFCEITASNQEKPEDQNQDAEALLPKLVSELKKMTSQILTINESLIDESDDMKELGFDSISQTTMVNKINDAFDTHYLPTLFFELSEQTLIGLSEYLLENNAEQIRKAFPSSDIRDPITVFSNSNTVMECEKKQVTESELLIEEVKELVSNVLGIAVEDIDENDDLKDLGFDSISQTKFVNELNEHFPKTYLPTIFFELKESTLCGLCEYLINENPEYISVLLNPKKEEFESETKNEQLPEQDSAESLEDISIEDMEEQEDLYAVIGMDCRMPQSENVKEFWHKIKTNQNMITKVPQIRVSLGAFTQDEANKYRGAFVDGVDKFDAAFYGISPHEAEYMDPQQRILLNCSRNAMEDAGYTPQNLSNQKTGVFIGTDALNYLEIYQKMNLNQDAVDPYMVTGMDSSLLSGRISYEFNLTGPCEIINTACSSSLSAVVAAMDAIKLGRCNVAIAGGVNLMLSSTAYKALDSAGMLSPFGKCTTFDENADGYVRGEGCGVVVIKPLKDAVKDKDNIYAVLCGASVNHGGRANSLTAPNMLQQAQLVKDAFENAGLNPEQIGYIEAHGTGTRLGDPVEINGLKKAFHDLGMDNVVEKTCAIGSVKTNIGHLEAAAGIAGLIKTIFALKEKTIPGLSFFEQLNQNIDLDNTPFYISKDTKKWEVPMVNGVRMARYACVSSFGFGGANAHVILREYGQKESKGSQQVQLIPISAKSQTSLERYLHKLRDYLLEQKEQVSMDQLAYTLQCGREQMPVRALFAAKDFKELINELEEYLSIESKKESLEALRRVDIKENLYEIASKWLGGEKLDWTKLWTEDHPKRISLPTYCFDERTFWIDSYKEVKQESLQVQIDNKRPTLKLKSEALYHEVAEDTLEGHSLTLRQTIKNQTENEPLMKENTVVQEDIVAQVEQLVSEMLHLDVSEIEDDRPLEELGLDSIGSAELSKLMNECFGCNLKAFMIYDLNTVVKLATYVKENGTIIKESKVVSEDTKSNEVSEEYSDTDIAVIGMSLKAPNADNLKEYWEAIRDGKDCVVEIPKERWSLDGFYDADESKPDRSYCKWGGFLKDIDQFDPTFFRMTPAEAEVIEPQQRLFLEESYKAVEMAGYCAERISGKRCGVYVGVGATNDYDCLKDGKVDSDVAAHAMLGSANCVLASRIAYFLNLKGPAISIDTACSSSQVAIHMASEALRNHEIEMAIAGGVTLQITEKRHIYTSKSGALSHVGRCSTFDESADGYVPSEGVGAVVLKRLKDAIKDGDSIYGVIKASHVNQDGTTNGITAPSAQSQYELVKQTYEKFNINPREISYMEAHGTGTKLGDPIEVSALTRAFGEFTKDTGFCAIGSVKAMIGHNSAASGVSALIKVLLSIQNKKIPSLLHYHNCNPQIEFESSPFYVPVECMDWNVASGKRRMAALSGFGLSGTNCHMVVEEWQETSKPIEKTKPTKSQIIIVSAKSRNALQQQLINLQEAIKENPSMQLENLSYTLAVGRSLFPYKITYVVNSIEELSTLLAKTIAAKEETTIKGSSIKHPDQTVIAQMKEWMQELKRDATVNRDMLLEKLANRIEEGYKVDLSDLFEGCEHTISLTTYPFEHIRCWYENSDLTTNLEQKERSDSIEGAIIEISRNEQSGRFIYEFHVDGKEFFLTDHVINQQKVFPAVAYLELVRSAAKKVLGREIVQIRNVVLAQPIIVSEDGLIIQVILQQKKDAFEYEIQTVQNGTPICHSQGIIDIQVSEEDDAGFIDLEAVQFRKTETIAGSSVYKYYQDVGVSYGECFQTIQRIGRNDTEVLSDVLLNQRCKDNLQEFLLHPALMDAMLQTAAGVMPEEMMLNSKKYNSHTFLPFVLGKVRIYGDPRNTVHGYIVNNQDSSKKSNVCKLDIYMLDANGKILVKISDYYARAIEESQPKKPMKYFTFGRSKREIQRSQSEEAITLIEAADEMQQRFDQEGIQPARIQRIAASKLQQGTDAIATMSFHSIITYYVDANVIQGFEETIYSIYHLVKALIHKKEKHQILFVYKKSENLCNNAYCEAMKGFAKSINQESSRIYVKCIELDTLEQEQGLMTLLLSEAAVQQEEQVYYSNQIRYESVILPLDVSKIDIKKEEGFEKNAVYLITGGAGKIGMAFAEYLCKAYAATVVLTGRSELVGDRKERYERMLQQGFKVQYITSDVTNLTACKELYKAVMNQYGRVNGIIHGAGIIKDATIFHKEWKEFKEIIEIKVAGLRNLYEVFEKEPLTLFATFSAIAAMFGNVGQTDYAYANAYMDSFMAALAQRKKYANVFSIEWPLWKEGGMHLDEQMQDVLEKSQMVPIETKDGIYAFETVMQSKASCVLPILLKDENFDLIASMSKASRKKEEPKVQNTSYERLAAKIKEITESKLKLEANTLDVFLDLNEYGIDSITITSLTNVINDAIGIDIAPTVFFELETMNVDSLVKFILENYASSILPEDEEQDEFISEDLEKQPKEEAGEQDNTDDIAIIGLSAKLPDCNSLEEFFDKLQKEESMVKEIPKERFDWRECGQDKTLGVRSAGLMKEIDQFAAEFFNISRREAELMDPQQRILLELVWSLFENAGYAPDSQAHSKTGVFLGISNSDYTDLVQKNNAGKDQMCATGLSHAITANRISYYYNLIGPSEVINSACSSSLLAVHRATKAILDGECTQAIAGGISTILSPVTQEMYARMGVLSAIGICAPFDENANGIMRGEGAGLVLLKKLKDAKKDKDHIFAVIKGSFSNHGGRVSSLTVPSKDAQAELIIQAVKKAKVSPETISYIECHGTGTKLGDPIEIDGIKQAFEQLLPEKQSNKEAWCALGSVKSNIGHLEAASGIASMIKVILSMKHKILPATIHFNRMNPYIHLEHTPFYMVDHTTEWKDVCDVMGQRYPRRAGISSFGIGGTNVHVVLEEYKDTDESTEIKNEHLFVLSTKERESLRNYASGLLQEAKLVNGQFEESWMAQAEWTLQHGRTEFEERLAIVCKNKDQLCECLEGFLQGKEVNGLYTSNNASDMTQEIDQNMTDYSSMALAWISKKAVDWSCLWKEPQRKIPVVGYPLVRKRYWVEEPEVKEVVEEDKGTQFMKPEWKQLVLLEEKQPKDANGFNLAILYVPAAKEAANELFDLQLDQEATLIRLGSTNKQFPDGSLEVDTDQERILSSYLRENKTDVIEIVFGLKEESDAMQRAFEAEQDAKFLLRIIKEANEYVAMGNRITIKVITNQAFVLQKEGVHFPELAALYGLVKCAANEYERVRFEYIDLEFSNLENQCMQQIPVDVSNTPVVIRDGKVYVRELKVLQNHGRKNSLLKQKGIYLVLGGSKGIGYELSKYLINQYQATVVATGRSTKNEDISSQVSYHSADITDYNRMKEVINDTLEKYGRIDGIINSTGVVKDKLLDQLSDKELQEVLWPKLLGNVVLGQLTETLKLDFIAIFSSVASFTGGVGRGAYTAAANVADQIALTMNSSGNARIVVINWSYWNQVGMQISEQRRQQLLQKGIHGIDVNEGIIAFENALAIQESQIVVVKEVNEVEKDEEVIKEEIDKNTKPQPKLEKLQVKEYVMNYLMGILKLEKEEIDDLRAFNDYGVDSLLGIEIVDKINQEINIELRPTDLINYPNIRTITHHIEEILEKEESFIHDDYEKDNKLDSEQELLEALYRLSNGQEDIKGIEDLLL